MPRLKAAILPLVAETDFLFKGSRYRYMWQPGNRTWLNERAVEIPTALQTLGDTWRVLEVGNVLGQYGVTGHDVADKYDRSPGVIQADAATFGGGPYDLVVSVSTLEHVGYDEQPRHPEKSPKAVAKSAQPACSGRAASGHHGAWVQPRP